MDFRIRGQSIHCRIDPGPDASRPSIGDGCRGRGNACVYNTRLCSHAAGVKSNNCTLGQACRCPPYRQACVALINLVPGCSLGPRFARGSWGTRPGEEQAIDRADARVSARMPSWVETDMRMIVRLKLLPALVPSWPTDARIRLGYLRMLLSFVTLFAVILAISPTKAQGSAIVPQLTDLFDRAEAAHNRRDDQRAIQLLEQAAALTATNNLDDTGYNAVILHNLGAIYAAAGRIDDAIVALARSYSIFKRHDPDDPETADIGLNLALILEDELRFGEAEPLLLDLLGNCTRLHGTDDYCSVFIRKHITQILFAQARLVEAESLIIETIGILELHVPLDDDELIQLRSNLAMAWVGQGRFDEAAPIIQDTYDFFFAREGGDAEETQTALNNLSMLYLKAGDLEAAEDAIKELLRTSIRTIGPSARNTLGRVNNLAAVYQDLGRLARAEALLDENLSNSERYLGAADAQTMQTRNNLALIYHLEGRIDAAATLLRKNLDLSDRSLGVDHPQTIQSRNNLARELLQLSPPDVAEATRLINVSLTADTGRLEAALKQSPSDGARTALLRGTDSRSLALSVASGFPGSAAVGARALIVNKGIAGELDSSLRRVAFDQPSLAGLAADLQRADAALARAMQRGIVSEISSSRSIRDTLARDLATRSSQFGAALGITAVLPEDVALVVPANAIVIDYAVYSPFSFLPSGGRQPDHVFAAIYRPGQMPDAYDLGPLADIALDIQRMARLNELEILEKCRALPSDGCPDDEKKAELERLIPPGDGVQSTIARAQERLGAFLLAPAGQIGPQDTLIISPDGPLHRINFDLLPVGAHFLFETNNVRIIPSVRALLKQPTARVAPQSDLTAIGAANYGPVPPGAKCIDGAVRRSGWFCPLPNAQIEITEISSAASAHNLTVRGPFTGAAATEATAKSQLPGSRVVLVATHAGTTLINGASSLFDVGLAFAGANDALSGGPASGLLFPGEDGILYGVEASRIPLFSTELVILSACDTALGDPSGTEGYYSLAYAFRLAGAANVLMSLWKVDDEQTATFMQLFYGAWLGRHGLHPNEAGSDSIRAALRETRLVAQNSGLSARTWGAFVLIEN